MREMICIYPNDNRVMYKVMSKVFSLKIQVCIFLYLPGTFSKIVYILETKHANIKLENLNYFI